MMPPHWALTGLFLCILLMSNTFIRCGRLKKLVLSHNRLITVPEAIHLLTDLEVLDLSANPDLTIPPRPQQIQSGSAEFYNIDFSLQTQMRLAGAQIPAQLPAPGNV